MNNIINVDFKNKIVVLFKFSLYNDILKKNKDYTCSFSNGNYTLDIESRTLIKSRRFLSLEPSYKTTKTNVSWCSKNCYSFINNFYHSLLTCGLSEKDAKLKIDDSYNIIRSYPGLSNTF